MNVLLDMDTKQISKLTIEDLGSICRTCLTNNANLTDIFTSYCGGYSVRALLEETLSIKLSETDGKPKNICFNCLGSVYKFYLIFKNYNECEKVFHQLLKIETKEEKASKKNPGVEQNIIYLGVDQNQYYSFKDDGTLQTVEVAEVDGDHIIKHIEEGNETDGNEEAVEEEEEEDHQGETNVEEGNIITEITEVTGEPSATSAIIEEEHGYICNVCNIYFDEFDPIYSHYEEEHRNAVTECIICEKDLGADKMDEHMEIHRPNNLNFGCEICKVYFDNEEQLMEHLQSEEHGKKRRFRRITEIEFETVDEGSVCNFCGKTFKSVGYLARHISKAHEEVKYACEQCNKCFATEIALESHKAKHASENAPAEKRNFVPCKCDRCDEEIRTNRKFILHQAFHEYGHREMCKVPSCHETFPDLETREQHMQENHTVYKCNQCNKRFYVLKNFKLHSIAHEWNNLPPPDHPNMCRLCDFEAEEHEALKVHVVSKHHVSLCFCGEVFANKTILYSHQLVHETDNLTANKAIKLTTGFQCTVCDKIVLSKSALMKHKNLHQRFRKFKCELCPKRFVQSAHLKAHIYTHTGEKPYPCRYCGKRFAHLTSRVTHERTHTGERPYVCDVCQKGFVHISAMKKHRQTHFKSTLHLQHLVNVDEEATEMEFEEAEGMVVVQEDQEYTDTNLI